MRQPRPIVAGIAPLVRQYWEFESISGFDQLRIESLLSGLLAAPDRGACWVAESAGGLIGYLLAAYLFSLEHGGLMAEIDEVFVTPAGRSMGVASRLLERAERDIEARGLCACSCSSPSAMVTHARSMKSVGLRRVPGTSFSINRLEDRHEPDNFCRLYHLKSAVDLTAAGRG